MRDDGEVRSTPTRRAERPLLVLWVGPFMVADRDSIAGLRGVCRSAWTACGSASPRIARAGHSVLGFPAAWP